jgi:hypothetical protein
MYLVRILSPKDASNTNSDSKWENSSFIKRISNVEQIRPFCMVIFGQKTELHTKSTKLNVKIQAS